MRYHSTVFTKTELQDALNSNAQQAKRLLKDAPRLKKLLEQAEILLKKLKKIPVIGAMIDDVSTTISMITDYINGSYREIPYWLLISAVAAIIYLVSPLDLIPDFVPFAGFIDDAAVLSLVFDVGLSAELKKYRKIKNKQPIDINKMSAEVPDEINIKLEIIVGELSSQIIAALFLSDDYYLEVLLVEDSTKQDLPIEVIKLVNPFPYQDLLEAFDGQHSRVMAYIDTILENADLQWSIIGRIPFSMLRSFPEYDNYFDIKLSEDK